MSRSQHLQRPSADGLIDPSETLVEQSIDPPDAPRDPSHTLVDQSIDPSDGLIDPSETLVEQSIDPPDAPRDPSHTLVDQSRDSYQTTDVAYSDYLHVLVHCCADNLIGKACVDSERPHGGIHEYKLCREYGRGECPMPQDTFVHDGLYHVRRTCRSIILGQPCTKNKCQFGHDFEDIRRSRYETRAMVRAYNHQLHDQQAGPGSHSKGSKQKLSRPQRIKRRADEAERRQVLAAESSKKQPTTAGAEKKQSIAFSAGKKQPTTAGAEKKQPIAATAGKKQPTALEELIAAQLKRLRAT